MEWSEIRTLFPEQWLVVEALEAHDDGDRRVFDRLAVVEPCPDGKTVFARYRALHHGDPRRELLYLHTSREHLDIRRQRWLGVRTHATPDPR